MKRIFKNSLLFLDVPQGDILSAGVLIMILTLISGVFGLIRARLLVSQFTPDLVGIYLAAFVIPDNIIQILVLSAMGSAFIPVFSKYQKLHIQWEVARATLTTSLLIFILLASGVALFIKPLSSLVVPGIYKENPEHINLFINLTRMILFAQVFFVFSYIATGILQSYQRFIIPALAPIFYNIGIVLGILLLAPIFGMYGVALGVILGAFLHLAIQLPFVFRAGFHLGFHTPAHPVIGEIALLMGPRALSTIFERVKLTIDTNLSSLISLSSITYITYALQVATFPVSLIAAAIAQAAFPFFAKAVADNNIAQFRKYVTLSLTHIIFLLTPVSVLLIVFHTPVVRLIFGGPLFSWEATVLTARTLAILSAGLVAMGAGSILARGFYAFLDTKTPLIMTCVSIMISIVLSLYFVLFLKLDVRSLAISTTIGAFINALALFILLDMKVGGLASSAFFAKIFKIFAISGVLGIFAYAALKLLERYFNTTYTLELFAFTLLATMISVLFYLLLSFMLNLEEYKELIALFQKARTLRQKVFRKTDEV